MRIPPPRLTLLLVVAITLLCTGKARAQDDFIDPIEDYLKFSAFDGNVSGRFSGLLDLEGYYAQQPPPGLLYTNHPFLFNGRLTIFLDVQIGPKLYFFAQGRADRGFDPADDQVQVRMDEYALRFRPWDDGRFNVQIGKFATVVGNWANRHDSWENPFITAPLPYENLTSIWDSTPADSYATLVYWDDSEKYLRNPVMWGPSYASGIAVSGKIGKFDYAGEVKNASLSSRPEEWDLTQAGFRNPTFSGRIGYRPDEAWNLGFSASTGPYLMQEYADTVPPGHSFGDCREILLGQDISYAWHHWQVWAEAYETRFEIPNVGNADTLAYYIEAKYKFTPQLFGALRWNQQIYSSVPDGTGQSYPWTSNIWRIDAAIGYRFSPHTQLKLQYSFMQMYGGYEGSQYEHFVALQFTLRF